MKCQLCNKLAVGSFGSITKRQFISFCEEHAEARGWIKTVRLPMKNVKCDYCDQDAIGDAPIQLTDQTGLAFCELHHSKALDDAFEERKKTAAERNEVYMDALKKGLQKHETAIIDPRRIITNIVKMPEEGPNAPQDPDGPFIKMIDENGKAIRANIGRTVSAVDSKGNVKRSSDPADTGVPPGEAPGEYIFAKGVMVEPPTGGLAETAERLEKLRKQVEATGEAMVTATQAAEKLADLLELTPEEQAIADAMEKRIETKLDDWYIRRNDSVAGTVYENKTGLSVSFDDAKGNEHIEEYLIRRFSGWRVERNPAGYEGYAMVVFWPK